MEFLAEKIKKCLSPETITDRNRKICSYFEIRKESRETNPENEKNAETETGEVNETLNERTS